jgi:hypothetical protein
MTAEAIRPKAKKELSAQEWEGIWRNYLFAGSADLVLRNLASRLSITYDELKRRIMRD